MLVRRAGKAGPCRLLCRQRMQVAWSPVATFFSTSKKKEKAWPVSTRTAAKHLFIKPVATGAGYWVGALFICGFAWKAAHLSAVPVFGHFVTNMIVANSAFGAGVGVGMFSGAQAVLIKGKWLCGVLPIATVVDAVSTPMTAKAAKALATKLRGALEAPSFVPRLARPVWRLAINQAIPMDSLMLIPDRIIANLKEKPDAALGAVVEAVLLATVSEGLDQLKTRYRWYMVGGLVFLFGALSSGFALVWKAPKGETEMYEK